MLLAANSSAVWAIGAFGIGVWVRAGRNRPAIPGTVLLLVAVHTYYFAASLAPNDHLSNLWASSTLSWLFFGLLAGTVFGTRRRLGRQRRPRTAGRWPGAAGCSAPR